MGLVKVEIELINAGDTSLFEGGFIEQNEIRKMEVTALVDSGSIMLAINELTKTQKYF